MIDIRHAGDQEKLNTILQFSSQCNRDGNEDKQSNCKQHSSVEQRSILRARMASQRKPVSQADQGKHIVRLSGIINVGYLFSEAH